MLEHLFRGKKTIVSEDSPLPTSTIKKLQDVSFIKDATQIITKSIDVQGRDSLTLEIYGTATSAKVNFKCTSISNTARAIKGLRVADFATNVSGGVAEIWQFNISGLKSFIVEVESVSGGKVSVEGQW